MKSLCVAEISQETAVNPVDIVSTLQALQMLKYWKGKHLVLKRQVSTVCRCSIFIAILLARPYSTFYSGFFALEVIFRYQGIQWHTLLVCNPLQILFNNQWHT